MMLFELKNLPLINALFNHLIEYTNSYSITVEKNMEPRTIYSLHNHGYLGLVGAFFASKNLKDSKTIFMVANFLFYIPIFGQIIYLCKFRPSTSKEFKKYMSQGYTIYGFCKGFAESSLTEHENIHACISKGLFYMIKKYDYKIKYVVCYGDEKLHRIIKAPQIISPFLYRNQIPGIVMWYPFPLKIRVAFSISKTYDSREYKNVDLLFEDYCKDLIKERDVKLHIVN